MKFIKLFLSIKNKKLKLFFLPVFLLAKTTIINPDVHNGEAFLILDTNKAQYAYVFNKKFKFYPTINNKEYKFYALIPVSYYKKPGKYKVVIKYPNALKETFVNIKKKNYKKEYLKVSKNKVTPPKKLLKRIRSEYKEAMKIYHTYLDKKYWHHQFSLPLNSKITSQFGNARVFNGKLKSFHSGIDFRAKTGTEIKAINDGVVVLAKNRYFAGNSVVISHGRGIYSCYYHLSKINVKKGHKVKKGEILGLSGQTGRVTGPHLHFTTWVDGVIVNPKVLISLLNQI